MTKITFLRLLSGNCWIHVGDSGDEAAFDQVNASGEKGDAEADRQLGGEVKWPTGAFSALLGGQVRILNDAFPDLLTAFLRFCASSNMIFFSDGAWQLHPPNAGSCAGGLPEV